MTNSFRLNELGDRPGKSIEHNSSTSSPRLSFPAARVAAGGSGAGLKPFSILSASIHLCSRGVSKHRLFAPLGGLGFAPGIKPLFAKVESHCVVRQPPKRARSSPIEINLGREDGFMG